MRAKKKKIIVVTITRIESDIIESFVRHTLTFADEIIIYDNGSTDGTQEILQELCAEGLPLVVHRETGNVEFDHGGRMTKLCFMAQKRQADLIVPLDVDEFLINTENATPVRELLEEISIAEMVRIPLVEYKLAAEYMGDNFLLWHECQRVDMHTEENHFSPKCILGKDLVKEGFSLAQGCHFALQQGEPIPDRTLPMLHLAHFHYRSKARYQAKTALGWLGTAGQYGIYTPFCAYMKTNYHRILTGDEQYIHENREPVEEKIDLRKYCSFHEVKYGSLANVNLLTTVMAEAQHLAAAYAAEKVKLWGKKVDVILPYAGDRTELDNLLRQLDGQNYPWVKVWIFCLTDIRPAVQFFSGIPCETVVFSTDRERRAAWEKLTGDYVFWIMPGMTIPARHISQMVANLELNTYYRWRLVLLQPRGINDRLDECVTEDNEYFYCSGRAFWQEIASQEWDGVAALRNVLVPQGLQQAVKTYFNEAVTNQGIDYQKIWYGLLHVDMPDDEIIVYFDSEKAATVNRQEQVARENKQAAVSGAVRGKSF